MRFFFNVTGVKNMKKLLLSAISAALLLQSSAWADIAVPAAIKEKGLTVAIRRLRPSWA